MRITKDLAEQMETGKQAEWLIEHSDNFAIGYENNIAVDGVCRRWCYRWRQKTAVLSLRYLSLVSLRLIHF